MQKTDKELNMNLMPQQILICEGGILHIHVLLNIHKENNSHQKKERKKDFLTKNYKKSGFGDG